MTCLRLILGDQLTVRHPWFRQTDPDVLYVLMEMRSETGYVRHHAQKVLAIFAAMRRFADALRQAGHRVHTVSLLDPDNGGSFAATLPALFRRFQVTRFERIEADEYRLEQHFSEEVDPLCQRLGITTATVSAHHFLVSREEAVETFTHKIPRLETFYRGLRRRTGILMTAENEPEGGRWNYDPENRDRWPGYPPAPPWPRFSADLSPLWDEIQAAGVETFGSAAAGDFPWPLGRRQALEMLNAFIRHGLPHFGQFQDALSLESPTLFHSGLSFALNVKMLHPSEVIEAALTAWRAGAAPLTATEGFIRQILGWREYVRAVYWARMPGYARLNALHADRPLPVWFWTGETRMRCQRQAISQSLRTAYAHHIQRLMVTGSYTLLNGCAPDAVDAWYLGIYIDAFEWVQLPNTRGMSQFADGGLVGSKPYCGSAAYIQRQGDYCRGCTYDPKKRHGDGACPLNSLYWDFHARHAETLSRNPRLAMTYRTLDRMTAEERTATRQWAARMQDQADTL